MPTGSAHRACRSCGRPILWAKLRTGDWVPLDPEPHERGQVILLDGGRCHPVDPGVAYAVDVQARRHWDHVTTCGLRGPEPAATPARASAPERLHQVRQVLAGARAFDPGDLPSRGEARSSRSARAPDGDGVPFRGQLERLQRLTRGKRQPATGV